MREVLFELDQFRIRNFLALLELRNSRLLLLLFNVGDQSFPGEI